MELRGRRDECKALDQLAAGVRAGQSGVLVVRGEAGVGKTALLDYLSARATHCRIVRSAGVEAEMELPFAGLHQLCRPFLDDIDHLPVPQREALGVAFGLSEGDPPNRFLLGLAILNRLAEAAAARPLICLIDDAQWLDRASAQILGFVSRRLRAESVGLVFAVREPVEERDLKGLRQLTVEGLDDRDAEALLDSVMPGRLDDHVRSRILAEARGNPLALLELPLGLTAADLAGGFAAPDARPLTSRIEQSFVRQVQSLPPSTQKLLLVAAAEPVGDLALLRRAAQSLGVGMEAASPALSAGLVELRTRVRFRHPLVRSASYRTATSSELTEVHRALAEATDRQADPDRRAWHLARAAAGPDEVVAAELEHSANRAQARGGVAAAAAFLDRAAELTPDATRRGVRTLAAAWAKYQAGAFDTALALLDAAELSALDELGLARSILLRGQITFAVRGAAVGLPLLIEAAGRLEALDPGLSRQTYRDALYAALTAGQLPSGGVVEVAQAVLAAPPTPQPGHADKLLEGLAVVATDGYAAGAPMLRRAVTAFRTEGVSREEGLGWLPLACRMAHNVWDFDSWSVLSARLVDLARETGTLSVLPPSLLLRLSNRVFAGDLAGADSLAVEAVTIGEATGSRFFAQYGALVLEPWRGRESATRHAIEAVTRDRLLRGEGKVLTATQWATAVLHNGLGRYEEAYVAAEQGYTNPQEMGLSFSSLVELVEAAVRTGRLARATEAVQSLSELAQASGTDWAMGTLAGARALVSDGETADALYQEGIELLGRTEVRAVLARARLLYGEWLRRENRSLDARNQLGIAHRMLSRMGADAFAERARRELQATGETVRKPVVETRAKLTPQETQIARLAGDGLTNPEIGAQLFLSPHTIEWHLRKVYAKLGISSRKQLRTTLPDQPPTTALARDNNVLSGFDTPSRRA